MDSLDMKIFLAEQSEMADAPLSPDRAAAEEKRQKTLIYYMMKYDRNREKILARRKEKYIPTGRKVGRPRLPRE